MALKNIGDQQDDRNFSKVSRYTKQVPPVTVEFQNLVYKTGKKQLLKSISGKFYAGELTAILGPSGAGKTTLLNVLSGHIRKNVFGDVLSNDKKSTFNDAVYITDDLLLQPLLTVKEVMMIPAQLNLKRSADKQHRELLVNEILCSMGLEHCSSTRTEHLSGGEQKRLTIALELINNPSVLFFDEPTSGLDIVATKNCLEVLTLLAKQGRTVICTIHQPSISILQRFQQLYFMSDGKCVYNGSPKNLVSHLESIDLPCPVTWNPADHIIEIAHGNNNIMDILVAAVENGKLNQRDAKEITKLDQNAPEWDSNRILNRTTKCLSFPTTFYIQFYVIFKRMMLQLVRSKLVIFLQILYYVIVALGIGVLFYRIGNNGAYGISNIKLCVGIILAVAYTQIMIPLLAYPNEFKLLKKEYSNKWYGLGPYYLALTLRNIPIMLINILIFLTMTLKLTDQPMDINRFIFYYLICILLCIGSEGLGIIGSALPNIRDGVMVSMSILFFCFIFSIYSTYNSKSVTTLEWVLMNINYMRFALFAFYIALFKDRPLLECSDIYCYFSNTNNILKIVSVEEELLSLKILSLIICVIALRLTAYAALRCKLSSPFSRFLN